MTIRGKGSPREIYTLLAEMARQGEAGVLATVIRTDRSVPRHMGSKMVIRQDGTVTGSVGGGTVESRILQEAHLVMADGRCRRVSLKLDGEAGICGGEVEVFLEPVAAAVPFWIVGAGHVGRALLEIGAHLPFRFTVVDDRPDFLADLGPVATCPDTPAELVRNLRPTANMVILIASRHHELDGDYLEAIFQAEAVAGEQVAFLGVVGSRTKARYMQKRFTARPDWQRRYAQVIMPVGMALGAETPHEIALSIHAEVLATVRAAAWVTSDSGQPLGLYRLRDLPRREASSTDPKG